MTKQITVLFLLCSIFVFSQHTKKDKVYFLNKIDFQNLKDYLVSKNIELKDTIIIKYDYNRDGCWDMLDEESDAQITLIMKGFQQKIIDFNKKHTDAIAFNFREPGNRINKIKLWDKTIIIDDDLLLKNLLFKKKRSCGNSVMIMNDGS